MVHRLHRLVLILWLYQLHIYISPTSLSFAQAYTLISVRNSRIYFKLKLSQRRKVIRPTLAPLREKSLTLLPLGEKLQTRKVFELIYFWVWYYRLKV
jgi:hypothetical protein